MEKNFPKHTPTLWRYIDHELFFGPKWGPCCDATTSRRSSLHRFWHACATLSRPSSKDEWDLSPQGKEDSIQLWPSKVTFRVPVRYLLLLTSLLLLPPKLNQNKQKSLRSCHSVVRALVINQRSRVRLLPGIFFYIDDYENAETFM